MHVVNLMYILSLYIVKLLSFSSAFVLQLLLLLCVIVLHHCSVFSVWVCVCTSHTCRLIHKTDCVRIFSLADCVLRNIARRNVIANENLQRSLWLHLSLIHTRVSTHSHLMHTFTVLTHSCSGGNWYCNEKVCERQLSFWQQSFWKIRHITWCACACERDLLALSLCCFATVCIRQYYFADWGRERGEKDTRASNIRTDEGKSQRGWEEGAGMKGTADRDRCTWSQNQPKRQSEKGRRTGRAICCQGKRTRLWQICRNGK